MIHMQYFQFLMMYLARSNFNKKYFYIKLQKKSGIQLTQVLLTISLI